MWGVEAFYQPTNKRLLFEERDSTEIYYGLYAAPIKQISAQNVPFFSSTAYPPKYLIWRVKPSGADFEKTTKGGATGRGKESSAAHAEICDEWNCSIACSYLLIHDYSHGTEYVCLSCHLKIVLPEQVHLHL